MPVQLISSDKPSRPSMYDCPQWDEGCSAPVCPLSKWHGMKHYEGEEICSYLIEAVKGKNGIPPQGEHTDAIMTAAHLLWANKDQLPYALQKPLNRAAKTSSKRCTTNLKQGGKYPVERSGDRYAPGVFDSLHPDPTGYASKSRYAPTERA